MLKCFVEWSTEGWERKELAEKDGGDIRTYSEGIMAGPEGLREMCLSGDSQMSKISTGHKRDHYCFVLMTFLNLITLIF